MTTRTPAAPGGSVLAAAGLIAAITLATRIVGFGRWLVFSGSVGTTCVGDLYQAANQLPNVIYEVAAGGALAAVAVPIIAGQVARGEREEADRTASAMLTWSVTALAPLMVLLALLAGPISSLLFDVNSCDGAGQLAASMLVVFAPQVVLYGIGIVLAGVLQAHRRFLAAALAPLLSSLVVIAAYLAYAVLARGHGDDAAELPASAAYALSVGTTLGVVVLSLPLLVPVARAGVRLRPTWRFPPGVARRAGSLAGAGLSALVAQQFAVLATIWVARHRGGVGTLNVYTYVQAVYLLPYAVLAVPVATSVFPALASGVSALPSALPSASPSGSVSDEPMPQDRAADLPADPAGDVPADLAADLAGSTLARSVRLVVVAMALGAATLIAVSAPVGHFFGAIDRGRADPGSQDALVAMGQTLRAFAPGLIGFGLAAILTRALYVRGRPAVAAGSVALGWLVAGAAPLLLLRGGADAGNALRVLGYSSSAGLTVAAIALVIGVRRAWGPQALAGATRSLVTGLVGATVAAVAGSLVAGSIPSVGGLPAVGAGLAAAATAVVTFGALVAVLDRDAARLLTSRRRREP